MNHKKLKIARRHILLTLFTFMGAPSLVAKAHNTTDSILISDGPTYSYPETVVGNTFVHTFYIYNFGSKAVFLKSVKPLNAPYSYLAGSFPGTGGTCSTSSDLAPGASCTILVAFSPTTIGSFSDEIGLKVEQRNPEKGYRGEIVRRPITGISSSPLAITDVPFYDYGLVTNGQYNAHPFYITNLSASPVSGLSAMPLSAPYSFTGGSYPGTNGTCGTTLAPGANCVVYVSFSPTAVGSFEGTLSLNYQAGSGTSQVSVDLFGKGRTSAATANVSIVVDDPVFSFGSISAGTSVSKSFTVRNTGNLIATGLSAEGLTAPFSYLGGSYPGTGGTCATTLASGATCTIIISFSPAASGGYGSLIALDYLSGSTSYKAKIAVIGGSP